jgi:hypothetical protein
MPRSAKKVVEKVLPPGYKVVDVPPASDAASLREQPDAAAPELDAVVAKARRLKGRARAASRNPAATDRVASEGPGDVEVVIAEPETDSDDEKRAGRRVFLVRDGKIVGEQG